MEKNKPLFPTNSKFDFKNRRSANQAPIKSIRFDIN
jgi:hypothetical protein